MPTLLFTPFTFSSHQKVKENLRVKILQIRNRIKSNDGLGGKDIKWNTSKKMAFQECKSNKQRNMLKGGRLCLFPYPWSLLSNTARGISSLSDHIFPSFQLTLIFISTLFFFSITVMWISRNIGPIHLHWMTIYIEWQYKTWNIIPQIRMLQSD